MQVQLLQQQFFYRSKIRVYGRQLPSLATNAAESRYHSFELEMLAVVKAIERFRIYLYDVKFIVITNCHAIVYANKTNLNPRIARQTIRLQSYDFNVIS